MTHDELLARIENSEANMCSLIAMDGDKCEPVHEIYKALRAVVELHKPNDSQYQGVVCSHCTAYEYPCPTIQAIQSALE